MIKAKDNQYIKLYNDIQRKKFRHQYGLFPAEGRRLVEDLVKSGLRPHLILYREDFSDIAALEKLCCFSDRSLAVEKKLFAKITATQSDQGILGVFPLFCSQWQNFKMEKGSLIFIVNKIQDPGNLGALIRNSLAAGVAAIVLEEGTVDLYNPKVVRSTMGAIAKLPIFYDVPFTEIEEKLINDKFKVYLSHMQGAVPYWQLPLDERLAVVLGNEGQGISRQWQEKFFGKIYIPQSDKIESLNVAMAAGIIAFDFQRRCLK